MDERRLATMMNVGRTAVGLTLLAPRPVRQALLGEEADTAVGRLMRRMTAVREIALGLATIQALKTGKGANQLLRWGVAVDAFDGLAAMSGRGVPAPARLPLSVLPPIYSAAGAWLTTRIEDG